MTTSYKINSRSASVVLDDAVLNKNAIKKENRYVSSDEYFTPKLELIYYEDISLENLSITLNGEVIASIPDELKNLYIEINNSKYILDLLDNHDDQGGERYRIETWKKAIIFLTEYMSWVLKESGKTVSSPKIFHGPDGSIDFQWKTNDFKLLINIPVENNTATFFGNFQDNQEIEGSFDLDSYKVQLLPSLVTV